MFFCLFYMDDIAGLENIIEWLYLVKHAAYSTSKTKLLL